MLEVFLFVEGIFAVFLVIIGLGRLAENMNSENSVYERLFFQEIERRSPQMYKILSGKTRKFNETEEKWVYDVLKNMIHDKKYGSGATEALRDFRKNTLDESTEKSDYRTMSPQSRKYATVQPSQERSKDTYNRLQKELREIEEVVMGTRTKLAEEYEKNRHFPDFAYNKELGIDVIEKGPERRMREAKEKIKKRPYENITPKEALKIKTNLEDTVSRGLISPEVADKYIKGCEKIAGIKREYVPTKEELETQESMRKGDEKYFARMKNKRKDAESYFHGPTKGRELAESNNHESIYRRIKKMFSGK